MAVPFDLNIEKILENWEVYHAIREVIANALDEQYLTGSRDIEIRKTPSGSWIVKDYGRGLSREHLTQKENDEKLANPNVSGKFGIGLKDALATFDRHGVRVVIKSRHSLITLGRSEKAGFKDIITLHAYIAEPTDPQLGGTEFELIGVTLEDIAKAKDLFLRFSGEKKLESTQHGEVLEKKGGLSRIYINGVRAAEEENFLFSYNITALSKALRKALNRERTNVGRTAYQERVKSILVSCKTKVVAERLAEDLTEFESGKMHEELKWIDVQEHAVRILNVTGKVLFLTSQELANQTMMVDEAKNAGYKLITVPTNLKDRLKVLTDIQGNPIIDLGQFVTIYNESFEFKFVNPAKLIPAERKVFDQTDNILRLIGGRPKVLKEISISETMRKGLGSFIESDGLWQASTGRIVIKRSALKSIEDYAGVLIHEVAHATSDADDVTRAFEAELTELTGQAGAKALK